MKMNINMKKIVFFLLVQFVALGAFAQEATIKEAEVAYTKEDYGKAIELYEGLLKTHGESAEIYFLIVFSILPMASTVCSYSLSIASEACAGA